MANYLKQAYLLGCSIFEQLGAMVTESNLRLTLSKEEGRKFCLGELWIYGGNGAR